LEFFLLIIIQRNSKKDELYYDLLAQVSSIISASNVKKE